jgi:hypothetical protein
MLWRVVVSEIVFQLIVVEQCIHIEQEYHIVCGVMIVPFPVWDCANYRLKR